MNKRNYKLSESGLVVLSEDLPVNVRKGLVRRYTLSCKQLIGPPKQCACYKIYNTVINGEVKECVYWPRTALPELAKHVNIQILFRPPRPLSRQAELKITLFDNQKGVVDYLMTNVYSEQRMNAGTATALLNMFAGSGKTAVASALIARMNMKTLYITPSCPLQEQAIGDMRKYTNLTIEAYSARCLVDLGINHTETKKNKNTSARIPQDQPDVIVIVINTALTLPKEFYSHFGFIIYDEEQTYCTELRSEIFRLGCLRAALGMSATTSQRSDGFDKIAEHALAFDGIIYADNIAEFDVDGGYDITAKVINYHGPDELTRDLRHEKTGFIFIPYMMMQLFNDKHRAKIAAREIKELYDWRGPNGQTHNIFVFCGERDALKPLYQELRSLFDDVFAPELDQVSAEFIGGISDATIKEISTKSRIILTTYSYSGTGISIPRMTASVFYTPRRSNMLQIIPRILRRGSDKTIPRVIVDIVDRKTKLKSQFYDRSSAYRHFSAKVVKYDVYASSVALPSSSGTSDTSDTSDTSSEAQLQGNTETTQAQVEDEVMEDEYIDE